MNATVSVINVGEAPSATKTRDEFDQKSTERKPKSFECPNELESVGMFEEKDNQMRSQLKNSSWLSSQKAGEKTDPITTNMTDFDENTKAWENEKVKMKRTKRKILFVNVAAIVFCTGLLINRASICLERFFAGETAITIKEFVKHKALSTDDELAFVGLMVCPNFFAAYNDEKIDFYGLSKTKYRYEAMWSPEENGNGTKLRKVFEDITHDIDEIFVNIRIKTLNKERRYVDVNFMLDNYNNFLIISTKYSETFGRCFSITPSMEVQQLGVQSMIFETRMDVYVYFGHPGQFLAADSDTRVYSHVGEKVFLEVDYEITINTLWNSELMSCSRDRDNDFDDIVYEKANAKLEKTFNCTIPFIPPIRSKNTGLQTAICDDEMVGDKAKQLYEQIETAERNSPPCAGMNIILGLPFNSKGTVPYEGFGHNNTAFVMMYLKPSVKVLHIVWDYDFIALVAGIGGYTGLLIGFPIANGIISINSVMLEAFIQKKKTGKFFNFV